MNTVGVMACGWGPCRAGQLAYILYRSAKVQQVIVRRGRSALLTTPQTQTCAPCWRLVCAMLARAGRRSVRLRSTTAAPSKSVSTPLLNIVLHEPQIPGNTGTAARPKLPRSPCGPPHSESPLACSGLLWRPWQLNVPPIRRVSPRYYWQAGSRPALPTAPRRATWLLTGRGEVQARRPPAELAPRRALHLHLNPGVRASTTGR